MAIIRRLLRTDGSTMDLPAGKSIDWLRNLIQAEVLGTITLHLLGSPRHVMLVDDLGYRKHLPVNVEATRIYLAHCTPGTAHMIRGDALIVPDDADPAEPQRAKESA